MTHNLVYRNDSGEVNLKRLPDRSYEKEDGTILSMYAVATRFNFVRNKKAKVEWVKNANGFKVRVKR